MKSAKAVVALGVVVGLAPAAHAQVCTESSPGVAQVTTGGARVRIHVGAGSIPRVNGASCGFAAGAIDVVGAVGDDTVILSYVPPAMAVSLDLGAGANTVSVYASDADDRIFGVGDQLDRDDDGIFDLDLGANAAVLKIYARGGNDLVDCTAFARGVIVYGGDGDDALVGGAFADRLDGGNGDDYAAGNDGNDRFMTAATFDGNDRFDGGAGSDRVAYTTRTTPVVAAPAGAGVGSEDEIADDVETITGGSGNDAVDFRTAVLAHTLRGGPGDDAIHGGAGRDRLYGEAGRDYVVGGAGRDPILDGGDGDDTMGLSADGFAETVQCGAGTDQYLGNFEDSFPGCEQSVAFGAPKTVAVGNAHSCAIASGQVTCWGYGGDGALGAGSTANHGTAAGHMGAATPRPDLGTLGSGSAPVALTAGWVHTCALLDGGLDDGQVKCWGDNSQGQLGLGDTATRGDGPGEMGAALPSVDLGPGRSAVAISSGGLHTCAILDDGSLKCWGWNVWGQLGLGDTANRGDGPGEMGAALPAIALGAGRSVIAVDAGYDFTCVILDDGTVKCWGIGGFGRLGQGDETTRGDEPGEMGDALPAVALGTGRFAAEVVTGRLSACALLDDGTVKCWGYGGSGQLGQGDTAVRGDEPGEMGDALPAVPLGRTVVTIAAGLDRNCAVLDDNTATCWGWNDSGALGQGDLADRGDEPGELATMPPIALGVGARVRALATGDGYHTCALLDAPGLKCWGWNALGQLGLGDTVDRGDDPGEMGDALPMLSLGGNVTLAYEGLDDDDDPNDPNDPNAPNADDELGGCATSRGSGTPALPLGLALAFVLLRRRRVA
jgi:uncharacterized protein (TIGR03382 family)